jgi:hypothetical protein
MGGISQYILYKGKIIGLPKYQELTTQYGDLYKSNLIEITDDNNQYPSWIFTNNYVYLKNAIYDKNSKEIIIQKRGFNSIHETIDFTAESIEEHFGKEDWITPIDEENELSDVFENDMYIAKIYWREDFRGLYDPRVHTTGVPYREQPLMK